MGVSVCVLVDLWAVGLKTGNMDVSIIRSPGLWWLCNCICMELYENIRGKKAVTSPAQRTLPASIAVAMETVGVGRSILFPLATDRKIEAQRARIRPNSLGRKKVCLALSGPLWEETYCTCLWDQETQFLGREDTVLFPSSLPAPREPLLSRWRSPG